MKSVFRKGFMYKLSCKPSVVLYIAESKTLAGKEDRVHEGRVNVLIVLVTEDIWWRPWCVGEIVSARQVGVPIVLVMMNGVTVDFDTLPRLVRRSISELDLETLMQHGIGYAG